MGTIFNKSPFDYITDSIEYPQQLDNDFKSYSEFIALGWKPGRYTCSLAASRAGHVYMTSTDFVFVIEESNVGITGSTTNGGTTGGGTATPNGVPYANVRSFILGVLSDSSISEAVQAQRIYNAMQTNGVTVADIVFAFKDTATPFATNTVQEFLAKRGS